jgi:tRNA nucleotidyltransferase (CCA-adding enzyme)
LYPNIARGTLFGVQVIVTHDMADFDALASCVAAQKLHPEATIVLGRRVGQEVRGYLALHKDRFRTLTLRELEPDRVRHLIVVDVRRKSRLGDYRSLLERAERDDVRVTVYDHHPAAEDDLAADEECVEPVGSASTLLVERMIDRGIAVDEVEATLFALGIHADTGSLTYAGTTPRDARALGWLMEQGASLVVLARYLEPAFTEDQRRALALVLDALKEEALGPLRLAFAAVELAHPVNGCAEVVSEVSALTGFDAVFVAFDVGKKRVQLVARSRSPRCDVGQIVSSVGGGGHAAAASGVLKHADAEEVLDDLRRAAREQPARVLRMADVMTSPVHCLRPDTPLSEARASLGAWRHTGAPVLDGGALVGIVSHRDLERAEHSERPGVAVKSCMSREVHSIDFDASPNQALDTMVKLDVGRLPVLRRGRLVGIVTRSDLLRMLYREGD